MSYPQPTGYYNGYSWVQNPQQYVVPARVVHTNTRGIGAGDVALEVLNGASDMIGWQASNYALQDGIRSRDAGKIFMGAAGVSNPRGMCATANTFTYGSRAIQDDVECCVATGKCLCISVSLLIKGIVGLAKIIFGK